jgi:hypothetical protein
VSSKLENIELICVEAASITVVGERTPNQQMLLIRDSFNQEES